MEKKIEIHFFHGFLGLPQDWDQVVESLSSMNSLEIVKHSLWNDMDSMNKISFDHWSEVKESQISKSENLKIAVGYSLGGRLLMHFPVDFFEKMILIASHPGHKSARERTQRDEDDQKWGERFLTEDWEALMKSWNSQEVFINDRNRPKRQESSFNRNKLSEALIGFSLSKQIARDETLKECAEKFVWVCGDKDAKFLFLKDRIRESIGEQNIYVLNQSGHGSLFDQPAGLAQVIKDVISRI